MISPYPVLTRLTDHLDAHAGALGEADAPLALAVLEEYLASGARLGRSLRDVTARFRPSDAAGALLSYLFVITVDAATHEGREGALAAYAASGQPFAAEAAALHATLTSDAFRAATGHRPIVGNARGCAPKPADS